MIYPKVDLKKWLKLYNLRINESPCLNCNKMIVPTIPFADKNIRGVRTAPHGCPPGYDHSTFRSLDPEHNKTIKDLFALFKE